MLKAQLDSMARRPRNIIQSQIMKEIKLTTIHKKHKCLNLNTETQVQFGVSTVQEMLYEESLLNVNSACSSHQVTMSCHVTS
jgi:hypothetical protein